VSVWAGKEPETVRRIEVRIGDQHARHDFGRDVTLEHARWWATHYVNAFTDGQIPTELRP